MATFIIFILIISICEIISLLKNNNKKEIIVFLVFVCLAFVLRYLFNEYEYTNNISTVVLEFFGIEG